MENLNNTKLREAVIETLASQDVEELKATQGLDTFYLLSELKSERPYKKRSTAELVSELNDRYQSS